MKYLTNTLKVDVLLNSAISKLNEDSVELKDGRKIPTKTLIWTAGVRACCLNDNLSLEKGRACRIKVDKYAATHDIVYIMKRREEKCQERKCAKERRITGSNI